MTTLGGTVHQVQPACLPSPLYLTVPGSEPHVEEVQEEGKHDQELRQNDEITITLDELQLYELPQEKLFTEEEGDVQVGPTVFNNIKRHYICRQDFKWRMVKKKGRTT